jgi:hypothetical protein
MGEVRSMYWVAVGKLKERDPMEDLGVYWRTTIKRISKGGCGLDSYNSRWGPVAGSGEPANLRFRKVEFMDWTVSISFSSTPFS